MKIIIEIDAENNIGISNKSIIYRIYSNIKQGLLMDLNDTRIAVVDAKVMVVEDDN